MKKNLIAALLFISLSISVSFAQKVQTKVSEVAKNVTANQSAVKQQTSEVSWVNKTLPNGLEVIVLPDSSVPIATIELVVRNGSFTEPPEYNGLSHLYEHMFFKPNNAMLLIRCEAALKKGPLSDYGKQMCEAPFKQKSIIGDPTYIFEMDKTGSANNGTTNEEHVNYFFTTTSQYVEIVMRYMRDSMLFPTFDEEQFANEKKVVVGELDRNLSNPFSALSDTMMDKLFYKYPTRKMPGGTRETVLAATTDQMRTIQSRYYVPNNTALLVTGDVDPEKVFQLAEKYFGIWKKREVDPFKEFPMVEHPPLPKSEGIIIQKDVQNVLLQIGWQGPSIGKDDASTYAADVFSYIVEQPNTSFQRVLIDSGLATSVSFHYYTQRNVGPIRITIQTTPDKAKAALNALYAEMAKFTKPDYYSDEELANAKTLLAAEDLFSREKLSEYTHSLGFWWSATGLDYYRGYQKNLRAITREDINRYITTYIQGKPHIGIALLSPDGQKLAKITEADLIGGK
jgi:zinc protease